MNTKSSTIQKYISFFVIFGLIFASQFFHPSSALGPASKPLDAEWLVDSGENHIWYSITGSTLTIGGTGEMPDWISGIAITESHYRNTPWFGQNITNIIINEGITKIGEYSFSVSSSGMPEACTITSISLPKSLTSISTGAFQNCNTLTEINFSEGLKTIGDHAFQKTGITSLHLPEGVESIGERSFQDNYNLEQIVLPSTLASIGSRAFIGSYNISFTALKSTTPPALGYYAYADTNEGMYFIIPASARAAYASSVEWNFEVAERGYMFFGEEYTNTFSAYFVNLKHSDGGDISSSLEYILADEYTPQTITLTATPEEGYVLKSLTVATEDGTNIPVENNSFTMPAGSVTVKAVFGTPEINPDIPDCPNTGAI